MSGSAAATAASLLGGIGLFLLGMRMMTDGLKLAAGNALKTVLETWTRTNLRAVLAGALITAIVQSSSAATVATVGFVNAGLLTLAQAVWVVFGANVGTTMTGWLVALVGVKLDVARLALPLLGAGMLLRLAGGSSSRRVGFGEAVAGFGAFFLGVGVLADAFAGLAPRIGEWPLGSLGPGAFVGLGTLLTLLTQSSSAAIAITLTASAGGALPLELAAAAVIGTNIGTTSTALFASLGATPPAKRVATAHIAFNLLTGAVALALLPWLLAAGGRLVAFAGGEAGTVASLAAFHTLFNVLGVLLMWPAAPRLLRALSRRFVSADEEIGRPEHLDSTLAGVPALALRALVLELERMTRITCALAADRIRGVAAEPGARQRQEGLARLGRAVRAFVGKLTAVPLPADVVAPLPDLIRASQHLDEIAAVSAELGPPLRAEALGGAAAPAGPGGDWRELIGAVLASLTEEGADSEEEREDLGERVETAYQSLKGQLLEAGARGRLGVELMEEELRHARRLRRVASTALKARRRLEPWINAVAKDGRKGSEDEVQEGGTAAPDEAGGARTSPTRRARLPIPRRRSGSG
ncbi:MAG: Na/Pi cotransporter family protein [Gammaproteobacteria bacterium]|nr:Na/Pi cotransporter family protein [Gammaproteobacteria bacterium]